MRIWEVWYRVTSVLNTFPVPYDIVLEEQTSPSYRAEGKGRPVDHTQISCTISGEGRFRCGKKEYVLKPGTVFMAQLGDPATAYWYPAGGTEPWVFLWVSFDGMTAVQMIQELTRKYGCVFQLPLEEGFIAHLQQFKSMNMTTRSLSPEAGGAFVMNLLSDLTETIEKHQELPRTEQLIRETKRYIESSPARELDIGAIAERLQVSREHLTRLFHEQTGMTPGAYALEIRMRLARRLIRDGLLNCSEIARRTGYSSSGSFARAFRVFHQGVSPAGFRKRPECFQGQENV